MAQTPVVTAEIADALQRLLPAMSARSLDGLARSCAVARVKRRDRIVTEDSAPRLTLLIDGYAGTWRTDADGHTRLVGVSGPGELAGLRALSPSRAPIELVALTSARVVTWDPETVIEAARADAGLAVDLLELSLTAADGLLARQGPSSGAASDRVIGVLWHLRDLVFDAGRPIITRSQVAELAGATRNLTDRVVRELEHQAVIERMGRTGLVLHDPVTLRRLADEAEAAL